MNRLNIGTKLVLLVGLIFFLFIVGLSLVIGNTSNQNLRDVRQEELARMSQVLASRISETQQDAVRTVLDFENNEIIVEELALITSTGPYYAEPGTYNDPAVFYSGEELIEDASQVFDFQAKLNLLELLQISKRLNNLSSISYYMLSPFDVLPDAKPVFAFEIGEEQLYLARFLAKGDPTQQILYQIDAETFQSPPPDYFDISSAYSVPPNEFYEDIGFSEASSEPENVMFSADWTSGRPPYSQVILENNVPVIQTWYAVTIPLPHPETWIEEPTPVGLVLVEQSLDSATVANLDTLLGLNVGFAIDQNLLITSLADTNTLNDSGTVALNNNTFYYATEAIEFSLGESAGLEAVVLSPRSELEELTEEFQERVIFIALIAVLLGAIIIYFTVQYLVNRPLGAMMTGVEQVTGGDLSHNVQIQSGDELGRLARAFNSMASQLRDLISSLEQRVSDRTQALQQANEELSRRATQLEASNEVGRQVTSMIDLDHLLDETVALIQAKFGYYFVGVWLLKDNQLVLNAVSKTGTPSQSLNKGYKISLDVPNSINIDVLKSQQPHLSNDVSQNDTYLRLEALPNTRSELSLPLFVAQRTQGVLNIQSDQVNAFDNDDLTVLQSLANQIGIAIRNAQLLSESQQARETAEQANQIKSQFLASVSHELRTPLNAILNFTRFVADGKMGDVNEMQINALNNVINSGDHLLNLINDVLDISKIEAGALELFVERDVKLAPELQQLATTTRSLLNNKPVEVKLDIDDDLPTIMADKNRVNQVMLNLIANACKFTASGSITIGAQQENGNVILSVADTGVGISKAEQDIVFEIFRQAQKGLQQGGGTGLGLAISKRLTEAHGGRIWLESEVDKGTTFFVELPINPPNLTPVE